jgi:hypothetical protein
VTPLNLEALFQYWHEYEAAMKDDAYNPVLVQALGMRFSGEWNKQKDELCRVADIKPEEFDYSLHWKLMNSLSEGIE